MFCGYTGIGHHINNNCRQNISKRASQHRLDIFNFFVLHTLQSIINEAFADFLEILRWHDKEKIEQFHINQLFFSKTKKALMSFRSTRGEYESYTYTYVYVLNNEENKSYVIFSYFKYQYYRGLRLENSTIYNTFLRLQKISKNVDFRAIDKNSH